MATDSLLYKSQVAINDKIHIAIPTIGEILDYEDEYYAMVTMLTSMPIDLMVQLDDMGVDFTEIDEYELFLMTFGGIRNMDTHLIFGDLDLSKFQLGVNEQNDQPVMIDVENDIMVDRSIQIQIADTIRRIHHLEKNIRKPANKEAKDFLLERERRKQKRRKKEKHYSSLETLIVALVNVEQFKYDYETVKDLTIYQFNESARQIIKKVDYDNRMHGVYAGTVSVKDLDRDDLNWLIHK